MVVDPVDARFHSIGETMTGPSGTDLNPAVDGWMSLFYAVTAVAGLPPGTTRSTTRCAAASSPHSWLR